MLCKELSICEVHFLPFLQLEAQEARLPLLGDVREDSESWENPDTTLCSQL
jgi:hypothetical protein